MGRGSKRKRAPNKRPKPPSQPSSSLKSIVLLTASLGLGVFVVTIAYAISTDTPTALKSKQKNYSLEYLVKLNDEELAKYDVAALNLACAHGLPGTGDVNIAQSLRQLDEWSLWVKRETERHLYRFVENTDQFENSEAYFRMLMLVTVAMQDFDVKFSPRQKVGYGDYTKAEDYFLDGLLSEQHGTCTSMPVLYAALGRRLGYPLKLVTTKGHVFLRWDDPNGERVNIEGTSDTGMSSHPDDHYKTWPYEWNRFDRSNKALLKSRTPRQDLASFLSTRAHCLLELGRTDEAVQAFKWAIELWPEETSNKLSLYMAMNDTDRISFPGHMFPQQQRNPRGADRVVYGKNGGPKIIVNKGGQ